MAKADPLADYRAKRRRGETPEPQGSGASRQPTSRFVIQRHEASTVHFDFRLEAAGVLASWSVPKGPSVNPQDKRLAVRTEDHPLEYVDFEGTIPSGQYGAGSVIVWDAGEFENLTETPIDQALDAGHVKVHLHGEKLGGAFALTRTRMSGSGENWLLVKVNDESADRRRNPVSTQPESVLSGRRNRDVD